MAKKETDIIVKANDLMAYIKHLIREGNVRRLVIKNGNGKKVMDITLTAGVGLGGVLIALSPLIAALTTVAAWVAQFRVEVIRDENE